MTATLQILRDMEQGSSAWHALRKKHITATDAPVILGASHWKNKVQLYHEKKSDAPPEPPNPRMKRGTDLEPIARDLFTLKTGIVMTPKVLVRGFTMASLDGISPNLDQILEIKCPGKKDHDLALNGQVPEHYYPQLQHQMHVADVQSAYYFSFDGEDGVIVEVKRDDPYIHYMLQEEYKFFQCLQMNIPPEADENDYIERSDPEWLDCVSRWLSLNCQLKEIQIQEEALREELIRLSGQYNTKGGGISLCQVKRKGSVDYSTVPQLKGVDLEKHRKPGSISWRISS